MLDLFKPTWSLDDTSVLLLTSVHADRQRDTGTTRASRDGQGKANMLLDSSGFYRTLHISFCWNSFATAYLLTELTFLWPLSWQMRLESMLACTKFVIIVFLTEWLVCLPRNPAATHMRFMIDPSVSWPIGWLRYHWDDLPFLLIPKKNRESSCDMFWGLLAR